MPRAFDPSRFGSGFGNPDFPNNDGKVSPRNANANWDSNYRPNHIPGFGEDRPRVESPRVGFGGVDAAAAGNFGSGINSPRGRQDSSQRGSGRAKVGTSLLRDSGGRRAPDMGQMPLPPGVKPPPPLRQASSGKLSSIRQAGSGKLRDWMGKNFPSAPKDKPKPPSRPKPPPSGLQCTGPSTKVRNAVAQHKEGGESPRGIEGPQRLPSDREMREHEEMRQHSASGGNAGPPGRRLRAPTRDQLLARETREHAKSRVTDRDTEVLSPGLTHTII